MIREVALSLTQTDSRTKPQFGRSFSRVIGKERTAALRNAHQRSSSLRAYAKSLHAKTRARSPFKRLVESGFGYSILPEHALRGSYFFQRLRIKGHRLQRNLALAMVQADYPRKLTESVAAFLQNALTGGNGAKSG